MRRVWCCTTVLALAAAAVSAFATGARAQASCTEPGTTILTDPAGDATGMQPFHDVLSISVSQPSALGGNKFVFTLKMVGLPATPPDHVWPSLFTTPDGTPRFVRMATDAAGVVTFAHGVGTNPSPFVSPGTPADPASSFNADGTIRIVVAGSEIGDPAPGEFITSFLTRIREADSPAGALTPDNMPNNLIPAGEYEVVTCGEPVVGACCASDGTCSDVTAAACVLAGGSFQGSGTTCVTTTCPPPSTESVCILPGIQIATDPTGDVTALGGAGQDIEKIWIAEPESGGASEFVFTMQVNTLDPANPPLLSTWYILFTVDGAVNPRRFVSMETCDATIIPSFSYGFLDPTLGFQTEGPATGQILPDGKIQIRVDAAQAGSPTAGSLLQSVTGDVRVFVGAQCFGLVSQVDLAAGGNYTVVGPNYCKPQTVSCPPSYTDEPGDHPLDFVVNNPSTASRTYLVSIADPEGWLVGGPYVDVPFGPVAPGSSALFHVVVHTEAPCNPPINNLLVFSVTATDLPPPNNEASCQTLATCFKSTAGVEDGVGAFSFGMLGSNPMRGEGTLSYTLPHAAPVRIEVFGVDGRRLRVLVNRALEAGSYTTPFRLRDAERSLGAGIYLVRLTAGDQVRSLRVVGLD